jgi:outer membrane protein
MVFAKKCMHGMFIGITASVLIIQGLLVPSAAAETGWRDVRVGAIQKETPPAPKAASETKETTEEIEEQTEKPVETKEIVEQTIALAPEVKPIEGDIPVVEKTVEVKEIETEVVEAEQTKKPEVETPKIAQAPENAAAKEQESEWRVVRVGRIEKPAEPAKEQATESEEEPAVAEPSEETVEEPAVTEQEEAIVEEQEVASEDIASEAEIVEDEAEIVEVPEVPAVPQDVQLDLQTFVSNVRAENFDILSKQHEWQIAGEKVHKEWSIFEPDFVASFQYGDSTTQNIAEDFFDRLNRTIFDETTNDYEMKIEGLLPTGAKIAIGGIMNETQNYLVDEKYGEEDESEFATSLGVSITQPLLKDAWFTGTMSNIRIAEAERDISYQEYKQKLTDIVGQAVKAYWKFYFSVKQQEIYDDSVRIAEQIVKTTKERLEEGKTTEAELYEAESGLALRRALANKAENNVEIAQNFIHTMLAQSRHEGMKHYLPSDVPAADLNIEQQEFTKVLDQALRNNARYRASLRKIEKADLQIEYAENQDQPDISLFGGYHLEGVDTSFSDSFDTATSGDYDRWYVGVSVNFPLAGGIDTKSDLRAAKLQKRQAVYEADAIRIQTENDIDTMLKNVDAAAKQLQDHTTDVKLKRKRLNMEIARLQAGRSTSQTVLDFERELNQARKGKLLAEMNLEIARIELQSLKGSLLADFNISIESEENWDQYEEYADQRVERRLAMDMERVEQASEEEAEEPVVEEAVAETGAEAAEGVDGDVATETVEEVAAIEEEVAAPAYDLSQTDDAALAPEEQVKVLSSPSIGTLTRTDQIKLKVMEMAVAVHAGQKGDKTIPEIYEQLLGTLYPAAK